MAAKLIDLSFTLNGRKVKVQIAPKYGLSLHPAEFLFIIYFT